MLDIDSDLTIFINSIIGGQWGNQILKLSLIMCSIIRIHIMLNKIKHIWLKYISELCMSKLNMKELFLI